VSSVPYDYSLDTATTTAGWRAPSRDEVRTIRREAIADRVEQEQLRALVTTGCAYSVIQPDGYALVYDRSPTITCSAPHGLKPGDVIKLQTSSGKPRTQVITGVTAHTMTFDDVVIPRWYTRMLVAIKRAWRAIVRYDWGWR
jgi:hypothetical protein